jgi:hypothetical protein
MLLTFGPRILCLGACVMCITGSDDFFLVCKKAYLRAITKDGIGRFFLDKISNREPTLKLTLSA